MCCITPGDSSDQRRHTGSFVKCAALPPKNAKSLIAKEGFDPVYGARPIKRTIQRLIIDPLAQKVLSGEFKEGDTVFVDAQDGKTVFWSEQYAQEKAEDNSPNSPSSPNGGRVPAGAGGRGRGRTN